MVENARTRAVVAGRFCETPRRPPRRTPYKFRQRILVVRWIFETHPWKVSDVHRFHSGGRRLQTSTQSARLKFLRRLCGCETENCLACRCLESHGCAQEPSLSAPGNVRPANVRTTALPPMAIARWCTRQTARRRSPRRPLPGPSTRTTRPRAAIWKRSSTAANASRSPHPRRPPAIEMADDDAKTRDGHLNLSAPFIERPVATTLLTIGLALAAFAYAWFQTGPSARHEVA